MNDLNLNMVIVTFMVVGKPTWSHAFSVYHWAGCRTVGPGLLFLELEPWVEHCCPAMEMAQQLSLTQQAYVLRCVVLLRIVNYPCIHLTTLRVREGIISLVITLDNEGKVIDLQEVYNNAPMLGHPTGPHPSPAERDCAFSRPVNNGCPCYPPYSGYTGAQGPSESYGLLVVEHNSWDH